MPFKQTTSDLQLWTQHLKKKIYKNKLPFVENIVYTENNGKRKFTLYT